MHPHPRILRAQVTPYSHHGAASSDAGDEPVDHEAFRPHLQKEFWPGRAFMRFDVGFVSRRCRRLRLGVGQRLKNRKSRIFQIPNLRVRLNLKE